LEKKGTLEEITPKSQDFPQWYIDVVRRAQLADYTQIKGCMVIRPYGYAIWENIKEKLDARIKATGHKNAYFPLFVPESLLKREAEHVEGFAPEVAWVTQGGGEELEERLAIRPTSEAIICSIYANWIQSYRDLPLLINQWANVVRWEKRTRPFLRTTEFLWQEGHTCHRTEEEAEEETLKMLNVYREFMETELAIPVIPGRKSESEKFAGALRTYTLEALMGDKRALQMGTSHNLGQHFSRVFEIKFLDADQQEKYVWQTSWGVSTRLIGAIIMVHGDDRGLVLPPRIAPIHVVIVPIIFDQTRDAVLSKCEELRNSLAEKFRVELDARDEYSAGWKFSEWELRGVPIRIEIGPKDLEKRQVVIARRDTLERENVPEEEVVDRVSVLLEDIQRNLYKRAYDFREANTHEVGTFEEFCKIIEEEGGFVRACWCGKDTCEKQVKEETGATIRCIPLEDWQADGECIVCGQKGEYKVYFARAY